MGKERIDCSQREHGHTEQGHAGAGGGEDFASAIHRGTVPWSCEWSMLKEFPRRTRSVCVGKVEKIGPKTLRAPSWVIFSFPVLYLSPLATRVSPCTNAAAPYSAASLPSSDARNCTVRMLIGCAHLAASRRMSSRNRTAGPKIPPPKIILSGLKRLTKFAAALPHDWMAPSMASRAMVLFASNAANTSCAVLVSGSRPERMPRYVLRCVRSSRATVAIPSPEAWYSKQPHCTYSSR